MAGKVCVGCLIALSALLILRQYKPEWAPVLRVAVTVCFAAAALSLAAQVLEDTIGLFGSTLPEGTWTIMMKALGLCLLTECAAGICRDSGEGSLASWVESIGRLELLVLAMPLIRSVMDTAASLLGMGGRA